MAAELLRRCSVSALQAHRDLAEALKRRFQALDNFCRNFVGRRQQVGIVERVVLEPEDIEIDLVALDEIGISEFAEALGLFALRSIFLRIAGDEIVKVGALHRPLFQREALISAEVVNP